MGQHLEGVATPKLRAETVTPLEAKFRSHGGFSSTGSPGSFSSPTASDYG